MPVPDLVIKLVAAPRVLRKRRPMLDPVLIETKQEGIERLTFPHSRVVVLDAARPVASVIHKAKEAIDHLNRADS